MVKRWEPGQVSERPVTLRLLLGREISRAFARTTWGGSIGLGSTATNGLGSTAANALFPPRHCRVYHPRVTRAIVVAAARLCTCRRYHSRVALSRPTLVIVTAANRRRSATRLCCFPRTTRAILVAASWRRVSQFLQNQPRVAA
jgi:hypothetical protein